MFTKKIAILSNSAVFRLIIKKFLEDKFNVYSVKNEEELRDYDLIIVNCDKKITRDLKNSIVIGKDIEKVEFISDEFKKKLLDLIFEKFSIAKENKVEKIIENYKYVLIGSSTGGPGHIEKIAKSLPKGYLHPICVAQHMPVGFTSKFAKRLNNICNLEVVEADNTTKVIPNYFIIANSKYHLHFRKKEVIYCKLVPNSMNHFFIPSVDEMFFSALEVIEPKKILAILLTGIGDDGAKGLKALKEAGAYTIAEDETAPVYGMPKAAKEIDAACEILNIDNIIERIKNFE